MPVEPATVTTVVLPVAEPDPNSRHDAAVAAAEEPVHGEAEEEDEDEMASSWTSPEGCLRRPFTCRPMSVSWKSTKQELQLHLLPFCCKGNRTAEQAQQLVLRL
ncbi:Os08g0506600 [Oryza sativa Japonica Group]|uniref:Os08g0506600 protein n=2 Tax=Oryza TaxID=4527 RepID=A0A0P0XHF3_ORYSJ|nr:Os08g0506600 [Oryza sativa Japonica Group]